LPDVVEIELIVQTQALAAGAYGDSRNDRDLVAPSLIETKNGFDFADEQAGKGRECRAYRQLENRF
jgi:hypothetical protein